MRPGLDDTSDPPPTSRPEGHAREVEKKIPESNRGKKPLTGAYYWLPSPSPSGRLSWSLLTCHDLGVWDGIAHRELWPFVLDQLASAWGKDPKAFRRRLIDHYYALPRGRVTKPKGRYLILHGNDAPVPDWQAIVVDRFHLRGQQVSTPWDEHERVLSEDVLALEEALGISLNHQRTRSGSEQG